MFYLSLFHQPVGRLRPVMSCQIRTEDKYLTGFSEEIQSGYILWFLPECIRLYILRNMRHKLRLPTASAD